MLKKLFNFLSKKQPDELISETSLFARNPGEGDSVIITTRNKKTGAVVWSTKLMLF